MDTCLYCGRPATTEIQSGWDNGGQYAPICRSCWEETIEGQESLAQHRQFLMDVRDGKYIREKLSDGSFSWFGPFGRRHNDDDHQIFMIESESLM